MKKIEIGTEFPRHFQSLYPEEFSLFSHLETASSIPSSSLRSLHGRRTDAPISASTPGAAFAGNRVHFTLC